MRLRALAGLALVAASCTGGGTPTAAPAPSVGTSNTTTTTTPPSPTAPAGPMVLGQPLPDGCPTVRARARQTVAFVVAGSAWALDPVSGRLSCLFPVQDPGPFGWGPQGDRVLVGGGQILFLDGSEALIGDAADGSAVLDWGRPIGKSVVFRDALAEQTLKYVLEDDDTLGLDTMPDGAYEDIAYHPSGLALGLSVAARDGTAQIFVSTNEGERPSRIVVGLSAKDFPSLEFTSDGRYLLYLANHRGDFAQLHLIDLADPTELVDLWKSEAGVRARGLVLPPGIGDTLAFTTGTSCEDSRAVWGSLDAIAPAVPKETRPTLAIGYLDNQRLLVGAGGCSEPVDLYVVSGAGADLVATRVDAAAARSDGADDAVPLPEELLGDVQEFG